MNKLTKPRPLSPGATIGIVAPSAGNAAIFPHRIETAVQALEKLGYRVKFAPHSRERNGHVSSSAKDRAEDIHAMFSDSEVSAIICTIGGDHSNQLLKHLDYSLMKENPKIFIGFSDISVLHYAFMSQSNLQTFYGPCLMTQFGEYPEVLPYTLDYFLKALSSDAPIGAISPSKTWTAEILDWREKKDLERPRTLYSSSGYEWLRPGQAAAPIIGGCVPSINHLMGTEFWIDPVRSIFFIDVPEGYEFGKGLPTDALDAYLADLDNLGVFRSITGLIVGRPYNYSEEESLELKTMILRYTHSYKYPILMNANIGHCDPIITLPLGALCTLDSSRDMFSVDEPGVTSR